MYVKCKNDAIVVEQSDLARLEKDHQSLKWLEPLWAW